MISGRGSEDDCDVGAPGVCVGDAKRFPWRGYEHVMSHAYSDHLATRQRQRRRTALWPLVLPAFLCTAAPRATFSDEGPPRKPTPELHNRAALAGRSARMRRLPDHDIRRADGIIRRLVAARLHEQDGAARQAALQRLNASVSEVRVDWHEVFGTPRYVGSPRRLLSSRLPGRAPDAVAVVARFVHRRRDLFGFDAAELATARRPRDFVNRHTGTRHLTFQQRRAGLDVFGALLRASVTRHGELVSVGSTFLPCPPPQLDAGAFAIPADEAVRIAAARVAGPRPDDEPPPQGLMTGRPAETRRVWFPLTRVDLRPAWHVVLAPPAGGAEYELILDAGTGTLLWRYDRLWRDTSEDATYRVYPGDSPAPGSPGTSSPDEYQFPFVPSELLTVAAGEIAAWSPQGWIDDGQNETQGNNVDAHTDLDGDDQPDLPRPQGSPYRVFNYPSNPEQDCPASYSCASVVQLFYLCNLYHDRLYELGFDEAAHNFQLDNFGAGGVGGDRILAQAQDSRQVDSASFVTGPEDGSSARLEMYLFTGPNPARDSALDAELVFHELSHGLVTRLLGNLSGAQPQALAEGWCDFVALALNAEETDDPQGTYPFGAFVAYRLWETYTDNYYFGLRRFPYSIDPAKHPQTYADIDPVQQDYPADVPRNPHVADIADDAHNAGQVWCGALLQCRANLVERYGFAGNQTALQLVVDSLELAVENPDFLAARDAMLQADLVRLGGLNQAELWAGFAARGMGWSAVSPSTGSAGIGESFDVPFAVQFAYPEGLPELVPVGQGAVIPVVVYGLGGAVPLPDTMALTYRLDAGDPVTVPLEAVGEDLYEAVLPPAACASRYDYHFRVQEALTGLVTDPPGAPEVCYRAVSATATQTTVYDTLEEDSGWVVGAAGDDAPPKSWWNRMDPQGTVAQPEDDHTPSPGQLCWVTNGHAGSSAGYGDVDDGQTSLTTPPFAIAGPEALLGYWRWFSNDEGDNPGEDALLVEISNDGGASWQTVEQVGPEGPEASGGWFSHEFFVSELVTPPGEMLLRFVAADEGGPSLVEAAVDDFSVTEFVCDPWLPGDFDGDGDVDLADFAALADCLGGPDTSPTPPPPTTTEACLLFFDSDTDGDVDLADFARFAGMLTPR